MFSRGKVRDVYELAGGRLLIVATDRLSAFDVVMAEPIPDKGRILTQLSCFWFGFFEGQIPHHFLTASLGHYPPELDPFRDQLEGRSMLVKWARPFPIECVVRGYLAGSGWKEYQKSGSVCGVALPKGLQQSSKLPEPIFTPATKESAGHDVNISFDEAAKRVGRDTAGELREKTLTLYALAAEYAGERGVIIADTKFEFGRLPSGKLVLIDEVLTPDSSRFWPAEEYRPGKDQPSFDKQFVRNYLESLSWNKAPPAPELPQKVVDGTRRRYLEAYQRLTGREMAL